MVANTVGPVPDVVITVWVCSCWWMRVVSETCRAVCRNIIKLYIVASCWTIIDIDVSLFVRPADYWMTVNLFYRPFYSSVMQQNLPLWQWNLKWKETGNWHWRYLLHFCKACCMMCVLFSQKCCLFNSFTFYSSNNIDIFHKKVKCTLVQALRLCTGHTGHRGSRSIALPFHDHGTRRRWSVSVTPRPLFTLGKDPVPIVQEAGCAPGPTGADNLASHRDSIPEPSSP